MGATPSCSQWPTVPPPDKVGHTLTCLWSSDKRVTGSVASGRRPPGPRNPGHHRPDLNTDLRVSSRPGSPNRRTRQLRPDLLDGVQIPLVDPASRARRLRTAPLAPLNTGHYLVGGAYVRKLTLARDARTRRPPENVHEEVTLLARETCSTDPQSTTAHVDTGPHGE